jgi:hypothetical protein
MSRLCSVRALLAVLSLWPAAGCSGKKAVVPVQGQVMYKGKAPAVGALVVFHPAGGQAAAGAAKPTAAVKEDGSFRPTTYEPEDGLPEGDYAVTIIWLEESKPSALGDREVRAIPRDRLKGRYGDPINPRFTAHVEKGGANDFRFVVD